VEVWVPKAGVLIACVAAVAVTAAGSSAPLDPADDLARIAFVSTRDGTSEIYVMNGDGTEQTRLTVEPGEDASPAWSPDGSRIAFATNRDGNWEIYTMDARGRDLKRLTTNDTFDGSPSWSPDGTRIVFASTRDGNSELYAMNEDGLDQTRLTNSAADDAAPAWAPATPECRAFEGAIAFESNRGGPYDLYLLRPDGSAEKVTDDAAPDFDPEWAPDCSIIAFDRPVEGNYDIFTVDLATRELAQLTSTDEEDSRPSWSSDGGSIAFTSLRDGHYEVYAMSRTGDAQFDLSVSFPGADSEPALQPGRPGPASGAFSRTTAAGGRVRGGTPPGQPIELTCGIGPGEGARLRGTNSDDVLCSDDPAQLILGRRGNDTIVDGGGNDTIYGGRGRDMIITRDGERDIVWGGPGVDQIYADRFDRIRKATGDQIAP
jgi:Tol biopolymer transport system component